MRKLSTLFSVGISILLLVSAQITAAQGNSNGHGNGNGQGKAKGHNKNIGVGNASDGIKGRIITDHDIYYTGDPLAISIAFPRGADLLTGGEADAYVVVFTPTPAVDDDTEDDSDTAGSDSDDDSSTNDTDSDAADTDGSDTDSAGTDDELSNATVLPVSSEASTEKRQLFAIDAVDVSALPAGTYQLGLILTNPGGDPLTINDWYNGLLGMIDVVGLTVAEDAVDFDADGDGEVDDDDDGDGFSDEDDDDTEDDDSSDDDSQASP